MTEPVNPGTISPLPVTPPSLSDPANFDARGDAVIGALPTLITEFNSVAAKTKQNADAAKEKADAAGSSQTQAANWAAAAADEAVAAMGYRNTAGSHATTATTQAGIASTKAGEAAASAVAANLSKEAAAQLVLDAAGEADRAKDEADRAQQAADSISGGPVTSVNSKTGVVSLAAEDIAALATTTEMQAGTQTSPRSLSPHLVKQAVLAHAPKAIECVTRTANTQLLAADSGKWIDITAGTFTQTFLAPAALGNGWWCYLQNSGAGDITIPSSDGRTNWVMYPNEVRLFQCDGSQLRSIVLRSLYKVFTASGNFIKPPGYQHFHLHMWGGGGSGASGNGSSFIASGGFGARCTPLKLPSNGLSNTEPVAIGAGGVGVYATVGNKGGDTTFAGFIAPGGDGGYYTSPGYPSQDSPYAPGPLYAGTNPGSGLPGGSGIYGAGAGGGGGANGDPHSDGGTSKYAGQGGLGATRLSSGLSRTPTGGTAPGGGGGGVGSWGASYPFSYSMAGARGEFRIWGEV